MTSSEKRQVRRDVQAMVKNSLSVGFRMTATNAQIRAACKKQAQQCISKVMKQHG